MRRTFLDAGVLIAAVRGREEIAERALAILEDTERRFITSDFLRMEVLPKAIYYQRSAERTLYERFFARTHLIPVYDTLIAEAYAEACAYGLSTIDALHITVAKHGGVEDFITTEKPTGPLFRVSGLKVRELIRL